MPKFVDTAERGDTPFELEFLVGYQLRRASSAMMATLAVELARIALTVVEASVLLAIAESQDPTQSTVGAQLDIHRANMAPLVARLEERRLIARRQRSGRAATLVLTAGGRRVAKEAKRILIAHDARYLRELAPRDRTRLRGWLRAIWSQQARTH